MRLPKSATISSSVLQVVLGAGLVAGGAIALADIAFAGVSANRGTGNPAAVARPDGRSGDSAGVRLAQACKAGNPCAAKKACNPCAAKKACNPCNPCAAKSACGACNPCNPCAGGGLAASDHCQVPRLVKAALCNPCAAKKACNPCNPCAAENACGACNPCAAKKACSPCNPCAAKKACNPCNPCAAKSACGACNPCNPCGGAAAVELSAAEAASVYDCLIKEMTAGYTKSGLAVAKNYAGWKNYATGPYVSDTHGARYVKNYANAQAKAYGKYEDAGRMPVGAMLAKDSFMALPDGKTAAGPLFVMEKMPAGFYGKSGDWRYTMVMPDGSVFGTTKGAGSGKMEFCIECHAAVAEDQDHLFFLPDEYRVH